MSPDQTSPTGNATGLAASGSQAVPDEAALASAHPRILQAYRYWRSIHPAEGLPGRQHIDPTAMRDLLPYVWLLDVQREPIRLRYRLVGTAIVRLVGKDFTGAWLDEAHPHIVGDDKFVARWRDALDTRRPSWRRGRPILFLLHRDFAEVENIYLPLARNGSDVDMILAHTVVYGSDGLALS